MAIQQNFPAIKPTLLLDFDNTEQLDPRITYSRASTATYYGTRTAKAEENLFIRSQEFDNAAWVKTNATITANSTTAPDGTTTAETMAVTTAGTQSRVQQVPSTLSGTNTISVFAKAGTKTFIQICDNLSLAFANFNLSTGAVGSTDGGVVASMTSAGNDWYRCVVTFTWLSEISFHIVDSSTSARREAPATTGDLFLWGAQAENRSAATAYTPTTTQPITNYIPVLETAASGVARFDHNPVTGESLGLLIEEQRTNLLTNSKGASGTLLGTITRTPNATVSPDGLIEGTLLSGIGVGGANGCLYRVSDSTAGAYTWSFWVKGTPSSVGQVASFRFEGAVPYQNLGFLSVTLTADWQRVTKTSTVASGSTFKDVVLSRDATANASELFIWGLQLEAGAFPTSYVATVASQVTRAADAASMIGNNFSSWYNQAAGTLYAEGTSAGTIITAAVQIDDGSASNRLAALISTAGASSFPSLVVFNGTNQTDFSNVTFTEGTKTALAYKINDIAATINAQTVQVDSVALIPFVNQARFRNNGTSASNGTIKKIAYWPVRVTNAQLSALTS